MGSSRGQEAGILVVDDDASSAQALVTLLVDEGYKADMATSGAATAALASGACRLLLLDPSLSDDTGLRLLNYAHGLGVPTIVMTSDPEFDPERTRRDGVGAFLYKPIRFSTLLGLVEAASGPSLPA